VAALATTGFGDIIIYSNRDIPPSEFTCSRMLTLELLSLNHYKPSVAILESANELAI
jgi:hypothetical protein